ncbi:hypothetical protein CAEBREN_29257 [Caenorhabditis brenneri]|uniref:Doublecortin domain-containing protein n=1 Tax=Caenorhabditis brenneri TaxID=135651 RepID=G0PFS3_CAEBE|nr:hypothetical protein CAEBREN_29257 [Caenorhabditis brenneri]
MSKQPPKTFRSRSSDHVPVVPTMVSNSNAVGVKRIHVWRNADVFFQGIQVVVNTHRVPSIDVLLDVISERIGLINGAKKLYTTSGTLIKDINKIKDGESYVASSSHFTPASYGGQQQIHKEKKKKKVKKRSKTVHDKTRNEMIERIELGEEITVPLNNPVEQEKKKKKKKKVIKKKIEEEHHPRHLDLHSRRGSDDTLAETAEVELPSEIEDSEEEEDRRSHHRDKTPEHRRPSTKHSAAPSRSASRRESRKDVHEDHSEEEKKKEEKRRKSVSRRKSQSTSHQQPNWGDLSSFTKNIDSLLRN